MDTSDTPPSQDGSQKQPRKRSHSHTIVSQDAVINDVKKLKSDAREGPQTCEMNEGMMDTTPFSDGNDLFRFCTSMIIPTVSPRGSCMEIAQKHISKPDFDYEDLCARLLSLEPFQKSPDLDEEMMDATMLDFDSNSICGTYMNNSNIYHSHENINTIHIDPSTIRLTNSINTLSCTSIKDTISEHRLSPNNKADHGCFQCHIGYPCRNFGSNNEECTIPPSSPIISVEPTFLQSDYLQWCVKNENQKKNELVEVESYIPTDVLPDQPKNPDTFEFKYANDIPPQMESKIQENSQYASSTENAYALDQSAPSTSTQRRKCYTLLSVSKYETVVEMGDNTTAIKYVTIVASNNVPCDVFNPNPIVLIGAKYVGINNPEVLKRIDYFKTAFGICNVMNPELGNTQILIVGINPNGENLVIGSIPSSCKLVVAKDVRGIRRVILETTDG